MNIPGTLKVISLLGYKNEIMLEATFAPLDEVKQKVRKRNPDDYPGGECGFAVYVFGEDGRPVKTWICDGDWYSADPAGQVDMWWGDGQSVEETEKELVKKIVDFRDAG